MSTRKSRSKSPKRWKAPVRKRKRSEHFLSPLYQQDFDYNFDVSNKFKNLNLLLLYLISQHPDNCVFINMDSISPGKDWIGSALTWDSDKYQLNVKPQLMEHFKKCLRDKRRFIIIIVGLLGAGKSGHSNILVIDNFKQTMELFEPHGEYRGDLKAGDFYNVMRGWFLPMINYEMGTNYRLLLPLDFCPRMNLQALECLEKEIKDVKKDPYGWCAFWSIFYADMRMRYPNEDPKVLLDKSIKWFTTKNVKLTQFIRNYTEYKIASKIDNVLSRKMTLKEAIDSVYRKHRSKSPRHYY